jgi:hypothetical protein
MSVNDLPAIMGIVLIVAGLALVGVSSWSRAAGNEKTTQAGALIIVVGVFLLGIRYSCPMENSTEVRAPGSAHPSYVGPQGSDLHVASRQ